MFEQPVCRLISHENYVTSNVSRIVTKLVIMVRFRSASRKHLLSKKILTAITKKKKTKNKNVLKQKNLNFASMLSTTFEKLAWFPQNVHIFSTMPYFADS